MADVPGDPTGLESSLETLKEMERDNEPFVQGGSNKSGRFYRDLLEKGGGNAIPLKD